MFIYKCVRLNGLMYFLYFVALLFINKVSMSDEDVATTVAAKFQQGEGLDFLVSGHVDDNKRALCQSLELEDRTLLEEWIESLQSNVIRSIPESDSQCFFLWRSMSCEPSDRCTLKYKFGDYSPNRACRLRTGNDTTVELPILKHFSSVSKIAMKSVSFVHNHWKQLMDKVKEKSPPSDDLCSWSFKRLACIPSKYCSLNYKFGDYSLNRACRLKEDEEFTVDN